MMTVPVATALLADALAYLVGLITDDIVPSAAQRKLDDLRERYPDVRLRLIWQREEYDDSLHYDLLINRPDGATVSLSYCPDRMLPWPLRGRRSARDKVLLRVNGSAMNVDRAIAYLDFLWDETRVADRLVDACLMEQELQQAPVGRPTTEEIQRAMDSFRRTRGLLTAAATKDWMARHSLSDADLEQLVSGEATVARLRKRETAGRVAIAFEQNRRQFDSARIVRVLFPSRAVALRMIEEIGAGSDFYAAAERAFTDDEGPSPLAGHFAVVRRGDLAVEMAERVFAASPGSTLGPFATADGHEVVRLIAVKPAVLDEATVEQAERQLFKDWIEQRRLSAHVEWCWGDVAGSGA